VGEIDNPNSTSRLEGHEGAVNDLIELPTGLLASISNDKFIKIWSPISKLCINTIADSQKRKGLISFNDDQIMAYGHGALGFWNHETMGFVKEVELEESFEITTALQYSPNEVACAMNNCIKVIDVNNGTVSKSFSGHSNDINSLEWNCKLSILLSGSKDGTVKQWNGKT